MQSLRQSRNLSIVIYKLLQADIYSSRMVAKMHWQGWGFCTEVNTVCIYDLTCDVFLCIPFPDCEINLWPPGTHWIADWMSQRADMDILEKSLSPARNWTMICQLSSPLVVPIPTFIYMYSPITILFMVFWLLWRWNLSVNDFLAIGSTWN